MIRFLAPLLCQAALALAFGCLLANVAHADTPPPGHRGKLLHAL